MGGVHVPKISIIGAGSAVFSLGLVRDLCLTESLAGSEICMMDIDEDRLAAIVDLCRRYADECGSTLKIEATTTRQACLRGADFVINTALTAGHDRLQAGWEIAKPLGYRFGGSLHVMHDEAFWINHYQLLLMDDIARDILDICPDAWFLLVANPVLAGITHLRRTYPELKVVGLCHGYGGVYHLADVLGLDRQQVTFEVPGVNHFIWLTKFYYQGKDAFPILDRWIEEQAEVYWQTCRPCDGVGPKAVDLYQRFGAFPIGDTGNPGGGSWGYWYHLDDATEQRWKEDPTSWWKNYFVGGKRTTAGIRQVMADKSASVRELYPPNHSGETMIPLIESLAFDIPKIYIVNVLNDAEYVPGVPRDFSVEIPALASKKGIQGIHTDGLPTPLLALTLRDRVAAVNTELQALATGSRKDLVSMLLMDPWTRSEQQAEQLVDGILAMPEHESMCAHYR